MDGQPAFPSGVPGHRECAIQTPMLVVAYQYGREEDPMMSLMMAASHSWLRGIVASSILIVCLTPPVVALSADSSIPWECSTYEGDAQSRCLHAFIEHQREQIERLEGHLQAQQGTVGQLKDQVDRQAAATADLQRQLSDRPPMTVMPSPYPYAYVYPPTFGFGLHFGRPWIYGSPYPYAPFRPHGYYRH
jgi:hypothetical protein